jgi:hypothetical protein
MHPVVRAVAGAAYRLFVGFLFGSLTANLVAVLAVGLGVLISGDIVQALNDLGKSRYADPALCAYTAAVTAATVAGIFGGLLPLLDMRNFRRTVYGEILPGCFIAVLLGSGAGFVIGSIVRSIEAGVVSAVIAGVVCGAITVAAVRFARLVIRTAKTGRGGGSVGVLHP